MYIFATHFDNDGCSNFIYRPPIIRTLFIKMHLDWRSLLNYHGRTKPYPNTNAPYP